MPPVHPGVRGLGLGFFFLESVNVFLDHLFMFFNDLFMLVLNHFGLGVKRE
jgi:hypothetical protein